MITDADRAKAAEIVADWQLHFDAEQTDVLERMIEVRLADARAEVEVLTRRAETAEAALSIARRGWDTARAETDQLRDAMRAQAEAWEAEARSEGAASDRHYELTNVAARVRDIADGGRR